MGVVWRADDTILRRRVAIKEIEFPTAPGVQGLDVVKERATREARNAAALTHPNVIAIYDTIQEDGRAYIVMEFVEAPTLGTVIERDGPMDPQSAASIALDILRALEVAHAAGIVHRDVKPANVMVPTEGPAKLADFGIATVVDDPKLTSTGMVLGSPQFMAPEQAKGARSGSETDLWSLGATLYYMVEGVFPFDKGETIPTLAAVVHESPRPPRRAGPIAPLISELLQKEPAARPGIQRIREKLQEVAGGIPTPALEPPPSDAAAHVHVRARPERSGRRRLIVAAITAAAVVVGAVWFIATRPEDRTPPTSESGTTEPNRGDRNTRVPAGWAQYEDPDVGYRISYPPGWTVTPLGDTRTDIRHPGNGSYLRIDWTDTPGDDPVAAWESLSESFAASHENYNELTIKPATYKGYDAAVWEFTYSEAGADLHAIDLGFVTGNYGFALNFQTRAENWEASQEMFDSFKESFKPSGP
jgi:serine/threonine protein kinase